MGQLTKRFANRFPCQQLCVFTHAGPGGFPGFGPNGPNSGGGSGNGGFNGGGYESQPPALNTRPPFVPSQPAFPSRPGGPARPDDGYAPPAGSGRPSSWPRDGSTSSWRPSGRGSGGRSPASNNNPNNNPDNNRWLGNGRSPGSNGNSWPRRPAPSSGSDGGYAGQPGAPPSAPGFPRGSGQPQPSPPALADRSDLPRLPSDAPDGGGYDNPAPGPAPPDDTDTTSYFPRYKSRQEQEQTRGRARFFFPPASAPTDPPIPRFSSSTRTRGGGRGSGRRGRGGFVPPFGTVPPKIWADLPNDIQPPPSADRSPLEEPTQLLPPGFRHAAGWDNRLSPEGSELEGDEEEEPIRLLTDPRLPPAYDYFYYLPPDADFAFLPPPLPPPKTNGTTAFKRALSKKGVEVVTRKTPEWTEVEYFYSETEAELPKDEGLEPGETWMHVSVDRDGRLRANGQPLPDQLSRLLEPFLADSRRHKSWRLP